MSAQTRSQIAELLERHGLAPIHRLGQHFLADANITRKIIETAGVTPGDKVVEVGAGTGTLTRALADAGAHVVAYEIDGGLQPVLEEVTSGLDIDLRFVDVMKVDFSTELAGGSWKMVSNLPYKVGTPLVLDSLRRIPSIERFVVMVQLEVAERFVATPGSKEYGLPSVITALHGDARVAFRVPPQVFYPPPNVESAVVVIDRIQPLASAEEAIRLAAAAFGQRRKMLRRSLASILDDPVSVLENAGIDPTARAEDISAAEYARIAG